MRRHASKAGSIAALLLLFAAVGQAGPRGSFLIGLDYAHHQFSIDHTTTLVGDRVRFFTGRPVRYLGWSFNLARFNPWSAYVGYGFLFGVSAVETRYHLNWEMPDLGVSLQPLPSGLGCWYLEFGPLLYLKAGPLRVFPYVAVPVGLSSFSLIINETEEGGSAFYSGLTGGLEVRLHLSEDFAFAAGYKTTALLNPRSDYTVEEGVTLRGVFANRPQELYGGIVFGWGIGRSEEGYYE